MCLGLGERYRRSGVVHEGFERHGRGVVWYGEEIGVDGLEICEAGEGRGSCWRRRTVVCICSYQFRI